MQVQNNKSTQAVIQDLVEPSRKAKNENNVSDYKDLDNTNEANNFVLLSGAKNRKEITDKTRALTKKSLADHDKYERHINRKYITPEKESMIVLERFNYLKNRKQIKTFEEYDKKLKSDPTEKKFIDDKIDDERLRIFEERSAKRHGAGATQEMLFQIGTGKKYDPLSDKEKIEVAKAVDKFLDDEFGDNLKPISSVEHTKESITHTQKLITSIDDRGRLNAKQAMYDGVQKYNKRHGLPPLADKDYQGSFKEFIGIVDDFQRGKCIEYGYDKKYDFSFADRGSVSKGEGKTLRQMKKEEDKELDNSINMKQKKLSSLDKEISRKEEELDDREEKVNVAEGKIYTHDMTLRKEEKVFDKKKKEQEKKEKALLQRQAELDKKEEDLLKTRDKISNKIIDFRADILGSTYPKMDVDKVYTMAVNDAVPLKNGHKEKVIPHVISRLQYYVKHAVEHAKPIVEAFKRHSDTDDYLNEMTKKMLKGSKNSYETRNSNNHDLER